MERRSTGLGKTAIFGVGISVFGRVLRIGIGVVTISILSRFIGPSEFGLFALILFVVGFAQVFADLGTRVALVQKAEVSEIEYDSVFWSSVAMALLLMAVLLLAAEPIGRMLGDPTLAQYMPAILPIFLLVALRGASQSRMERMFGFGRIAAADTAASLTGAAIAIWLVFRGQTLGALIARELATAAVMTVIILVAVRWRPRLRFSWGALRPLMHYGSYVTGAGLLQYVAGSAERPIIGSQLSTRDLGQLTMGQQLLQAPLRAISTQFRGVAFPIFSSIQDDQVRLGRAYLRAAHAGVLVLGPICLGIGALADPIVRVLLGQEWHGIGPLIVLLAVGAFVNSIGEFNVTVMAALGKAQLQFRIGIASAAVQISLMLWLVRFGLMSVVAGKVAVWALFLLITTVITGRMLGLRPWDLLGAVWRPAVAGLLMTAIVVLLDRLLLGPNLEVLPRLVAGAAAGGIAYAGLILLIDGRQLRSVLNMARARPAPGAE